MSDNRPTIPAGDIIRSFKLPKWLRWIMEAVRGLKIRAGKVDIQLSEKDRPK